MAVCVPHFTIKINGKNNDSTDFKWAIFGL